jgi:hypothetical protein
VTAIKQAATALSAVLFVRRRARASVALALARVAAAQRVGAGATADDELRRGEAVHFDVGVRADALPLRWRTARRALAAVAWVRDGLVAARQRPRARQTALRQLRATRLRRGKELSPAAAHQILFDDIWARRARAGVARLEATMTADERAAAGLPALVQRLHRLAAATRGAAGGLAGVAPAQQLGAACLVALYLVRVAAPDLLLQRPTGAVHSALHRAWRAAALMTDLCALVQAAHKHALADGAATGDVVGALEARLRERRLAAVARRNDAWVRVARRACTVTRVAHHRALVRAAALQALARVVA